jgi:flagellar hook-length control protein FliK
MGSLRLNVGRQRSTARLHLRPPELGRIRIDARMDGQRLEVLVQTETRAARELLQARGADLQASLEQQGIKVDRFEFSAAWLDDRQDSTGSFAQAGDPNAGRSAARQDAGQSAGQHGSAREDMGNEAGGPVEVEGTESTFGAAAETRLDVRV